MRNIGLKISVILVILLYCLWSLYPPQETLRFGKDLRGGVSLIYAVDIPEDAADPQAVISQVITVLKDRVNPSGVLDISMEALGNDRIEVVMPLPSEEVLELRRQYEAALDDLLAKAEIDAAALDQAVRFGDAVEQFGGEEGTGRYQDIRALQDTYTYLQQAREALRAARESDAAPTEIARLEDDVALMELQYESIREDVLAGSLERSRLLRALALPDAPAPGVQPVTEPDTGEQVVPTQRDVALDELKVQYPHLADDMNEVVAAYDAFTAERTGYDDPQDLIRLLRGAGVLEYHIAVSPSQPEGVNIANLRDQLQERGPDNIDSAVAGWYSINDLRQWYETPEELDALRADPRTYFQTRYGLVADEWNGQYYLLLYTTDARSITHDQGYNWSIVRAGTNLDEFGREAVSFQLDQVGAQRMGALTRENIGRPMAIVLDNEVYSAPTIQGQITRSGQITGNFSQKEITYLVKVLAAGALEARLSPEPIAINTLGPTLGLDNLMRGMWAFAWALVAVAVFMTLYYFFAGIVAVLALAANGVIIFGVMSMLDATFTLPGLAGIVLTIGMAVDANVLIYERIREELFDTDVDLRTAIRLGYSKALSTIIDGNVTNLIVCFVLGLTATTEVKGFAVTLGVGICATLFTALFVTRVIYTLYTELFKAETLPMLPTVFPAVHRTLEPSINWIGMRKAFWAVSTVAVVGSVLLVGSRGVDLFDTELRGGVSVTFETASTDDGPLLLPHVGEGSVEDRIRSIAEQVGDPAAAPTPEEAQRRAILREFANASVLTVGTTDRDPQDGVIASRFQVKVASPKGLDEDVVITDAVVEGIVDEFGDQLDVARPVDFRGMEDGSFADFTYEITDEDLSRNIPYPQVTTRVPEFLGGVAVVVEDLDPPLTTQEIEQRIESLRRQPDYSNTLGRTIRVIGLTPAVPGDPSQGYSDVAVLVKDNALSLLAGVSYETWNERLAEVEWNLVSEALSQPPQLAQVSSYSAAVADSLAASAVVAVIVTLLAVLAYIWVRFGSLRYSVAAIAALVHDVTVALGVLALTAWLGRTTFGSMLLIEEFRIDLGVVAALLTIVGYSLNDTIVILDRIRENRGKRPLPTAAIVNRSINQTVSRTVLTSFTTLLAVLIMYAEGGSGIRPFAFCLMTGLIVGTYSSVAIAAPLVFAGGGTRPAAEETTTSAARREERPAVAAT